MAAVLQGSSSGTTFTITTEFGQWELPNDKEKHNKKSVTIFLRAWCDPHTTDREWSGPDRADCPAGQRHAILYTH